MRYFIIKKRKILKIHQYYIWYSIGQKADIVFISSNIHPPKVCTLFKKNIDKKQRGKERTEFLNLNINKP